METTKPFTQFKESCDRIEAKISRLLDGEDSKEAIFALHESICQVILQTPATKKQKYEMYSILAGFFDIERQRLEIEVEV